MMSAQCLTLAPLCVVSCSSYLGTPSQQHTSRSPLQGTVTHLHQLSGEDCTASFLLVRSWQAACLLPTANCIADWHTSMWKSRCRNVSAHTYHLTTASHDCRPQGSRPYPVSCLSRHRCAYVSLQCRLCRPDARFMGWCTHLLPATLLPLSNKCQSVLPGTSVEQGQTVS